MPAMDLYVPRSISCATFRSPHDLVRPLPFREFHNVGTSGWSALEDLGCRLLEFRFSVADGQEFHRKPAPPQSQPT